MAMLKLPLLYLYVSVIFMHVLNPVESTVQIRLDQAPPARSRHSYAIFRYSFEWLNGSNACQDSMCSIHCQVCTTLLLILSFYSFLQIMLILNDYYITNYNKSWWFQMAIMWGNNFCKFSFK